MAIFPINQNFSRLRPAKIDDVIKVSTAGMIKKYRLLIISFFFTSSLLAQHTGDSFYIDIPFVSRDTVFKRTLQSLLLSEYFITSADRDAGFIQCKIVVNNKRLLSAKKGDILNYNILIQNGDSGNIKIYLQANLKEKMIVGSVGNAGYYNDDNGVSYDSRYYEPLINYLKTYVISPLDKDTNPNHISGERTLIPKDTVILTAIPHEYKTGTLPDSIIIRITNNLQEPITTGLYYHIESYNRGWKKVSPDQLVEDLGYAILPGAFETFNVSLLKSKIKYEPGRYRIVKRYLKSDYRKTQKIFDTYTEIVIE